MIDLGKFEGDPIELKWNAKDLGSLEQVLTVAAGRRCAVQAGGCLGAFPKRLAQEFETVYTFEPSAELFPLLVKNAPEPNIIRFQAALGASVGMVKTACSLRGNDGKTVLHKGMTRVEVGGPIPVMTIDSLFLRDVDLIYLDIEGWELHALNGARNTIRLWKPVVAVEINRGVEYLGFKQDDVRTALRMLGYRHRMSLRSDEVWVPC